VQRGADQNGEDDQRNSRVVGRQDKIEKSEYPERDQARRGNGNDQQQSQ
jgi:hypothetical protein